MKIEICDLTKVIKGSTILESISLDMTSGNIYGFQGVNGSGKTMLMREICGLILPTRGSVKIDGAQIGKDISFPKSVGLLLENPSFIGGYTGFENLKILAGIKNIVTDDEIKKSLSAVGLDPDDKRKYKKYSLGMKQRLGIACAVFEDPDLIIVDEPFNALDEEGCTLIEQLIVSLKEKGKLIILSCHDKEQLEHISDQIFILSQGSLKEKKINDTKEN